jgi:hypothetical protein
LSSYKKLGNGSTDLDVFVRRARNNAEQTFNYQIRSEQIKSREEGTSLCETLKKAGHLGCFVIQHNDHQWQSLAEAGAGNKMSKDSRQRHTETFSQNGSKAPDPVSLIIELPSSNVMEGGHRASGWSEALPLGGIVQSPAPMADI